MADIQKLIDMIGKIAPSIGTALGGPLAGAALEILAQALGAKTATPGGVAEAVQATDPETVKAQLAKAEAEFRAAAEQAVTLRSQIGAHVEMMKLDYARGFYYSGWRPLAAWAGVVLAIIAPFLAIAELLSGAGLVIGNAGQIIALASPLWAFAGLYTWGRSAERKAVATGVDLGALVKAIVGRKT